VLPSLTQASTALAYQPPSGLGHVVRQRAAGTNFLFETAGLATGICTLRLQTGATTLAKLIVVR